MRFTLKLRNVVVGRSNLEKRDAATRVARGAFRPGIGYDLVEPVFALSRVDPALPASGAQSERYRKARDTLALELLAADGSLVETSRIDIVRDGQTSEALVLEVEIVDDAFWLAPGSP